MNLDIIHNKNADGGDLIFIKGEVDAFTAPKLKEAILPLVETGNRSVTLNLKETYYMDSTAIGVIIAAYKLASKSQSKLIVEDLTPRVRRLFDITGLSEILTIHDIKKEETP